MKYSLRVQNTVQMTVHLLECMPNGWLRRPWTKQSGFHRTVYLKNQCLNHLRIDNFSRCEMKCSSEFKKEPTHTKRETDGNSSFDGHGGESVVGTGDAPAPRRYDQFAPDLHTSDHFKNLTDFVFNM